MSKKQEITTPEWVKDAVFYQIFPDRFAKSSRVPKPTNIQPWDAPPQDKGYQGGDLLGIVEHLDYIQELGINAIYLNPIFQSACNHRYHTHDYFQVDPMLGGNAALRELVTEAHKRHIRIVLDGVFNHASRGFFQFNDILEQGPESAYLDWFFVEDWPLNPYDGSKPANYLGWWGIRDLPKFNTDNPQVREFLMQVGEYWVREFEIDGWRLDVAAEITTPGFWEEFRQRVKAINPETYIVAEIWHEAQEWLQGDRFDATMNYEFTAAVLAYTVGDRLSMPLVEGRGYKPYPALDAIGYGRSIDRLLKLYDWNVSQVQLNSLDSHDTARYLSIAQGDKASLVLGTVLQMTYPGAPCVYYGNEICINGTKQYQQPHSDKDARWTFPWAHEAFWDKEMLASFKALIALRHAHPALRRGSYTQWAADGDVYVFARQLKKDVVVTAVNASRTSTKLTIPRQEPLQDGQTLKPIFGSSDPLTVVNGRFSPTIPARSAIIYTIG
jgi:glycosidase